MNKVTRGTGPFVSAALALLILSLSTATSFAEGQVKATNEKDIVKTYKSSDGKVFKEDSEGNLYYLRSDGRVLKAEKDGDSVVVNGQVVTSNITEYKKNENDGKAQGPQGTSTPTSIPKKEEPSSTPVKTPEPVKTPSPVSTPSPANTPVSTENRGEGTGGKVFRVNPDGTFQGTGADSGKVYKKDETGRLVEVQPTASPTANPTNAPEQKPTMTPVPTVILKTLVSPEGKVFKQDSEGNLFYLRSDGRVLRAKLEDGKVTVEGQVVAEKLEEHQAVEDTGKGSNKTVESASQQKTKPVENPGESEESKGTPVNKTETVISPDADKIVEFKAREARKEVILSQYTEEEQKKLVSVSKSLGENNSGVTVIPVENIQVEGGKVKFDTPPVIKDNVTLIPVRALSEALGASVQWNPDENKVVIIKGDTVIRMYINSKIVSVNGVETAIEVPAQTLNDRTVLPLRFIAESLGATVNWHQEDGTIEIKD